MGFVHLTSNTQPVSTVHGKGDFKIKQELRMHFHPIYKHVFTPICTASLKSEKIWVTLEVFLSI